MEARYESILGVVRKRFPELKGLGIRLEVRSFYRGSMRATRLQGGYLIIIDDKKYLRAGKKEIAGAFAHELSHFCSYRNKSWAGYFLWYLHYHFSRKFRHKVEIETDKQAIIRGFARELFANRSFIIKKYPLPKRKENRAYLTPEEIKEYALSINKW